MQQNATTKLGKTDEEKKKKLDAEFKKLSPDERLQKVVIRSIEQDCLKRVFERLCVLEKEASSDEDSKTKKYKKLIEEKANEKKMKLEFKPTASINLNESKKQKSPKKYKEDDHSPKKQIPITNTKEDDELLKINLDKKIGIKSIRKVLRILDVENITKEEMQLMIWVNFFKILNFIFFNF